MRPYHTSLNFVHAAAEGSMAEEHCAPLPCFADVRPDRPEVFGLEGCDDLVALHSECERGRLAGPIGNHRGIQIAILALHTLLTSYT